MRLIFIFSLFVSAANLFAMEATTERASIERDWAWRIRKDNKGKYFKFNTRESLERALMDFSGNETWEKTKHMSHDERKIFTKKQKLSKVKLLCVKDNAPEFWRAFLDQLSGKIIAVERLGEIISEISKTIVKKPEDYVGIFTDDIVATEEDLEGIVVTQGLQFWEMFLGKENSFGGW